jgi:hypothetical protein
MFRERNDDGERYRIDYEIQHSGQGQPQQLVLGHSRKPGLPIRPGRGQRSQRDAVGIEE